MLSDDVKRRLELLRRVEKGRNDSAFGSKLIEEAIYVDRTQYGGNLSKTIENIINTKCPNINNHERDKLIADLWKMRVLYLLDPEEYFLYDFQSLDDKARYQFVGNREKETLCAIINKCEISDIFSDKWKTYEKFKSYYGRKAIHITSDYDEDIFRSFLQSNEKTIIKVTNGSQGKGIFLYNRDFDNLTDTWTKVTKIIAEESNVIAEEYIQQSPAVAEFNESSVNTVRIATFRDEEDIIKMFTFIRIGRKGSVVDNGGSGGIIVSIDMDTGEFITDGRDEQGIVYQYHPDSGKKIKGFVMPKWNEAIDLAERLSMVIPEQIYVGWDLALTSNEWVMIEGNSWSQFLGPQIAQRKGVRDIVDRTFYKVIGI